MARTKFPGNFDRLGRVRSSQAMSSQGEQKDGGGSQAPRVEKGQKKKKKKVAKNSDMLVRFNLAWQVVESLVLLCSGLKASGQTIVKISKIVAGSGKNADTLCLRFQFEEGKDVALAVKKFEREGSREEFAEFIAKLSSNPQSVVQKDCDELVEALRAPESGKYQYLFVFSPVFNGK